MLEILNYIDEWSFYIGMFTGGLLILLISIPALDRYYKRTGDIALGEIKKQYLKKLAEKCQECDKNGQHIDNVDHA